MASPPKIFLTGATGYIGGDALALLQERHPDWSYTCLVRNSDKGAQIASKYPKIRMVYGSLDSKEVLETEAKEADIVLHCASADILPGAQSLISGLSSPSRTKQGYLIHLSGTGILQFPDIDQKTVGEHRSKIWDDMKDIKEIIEEIPDHAPHRVVDKAVLAANDVAGGEKVKTAIICPPTIYGRGRGPGNIRSIQVPSMTRCMLQRGKGFTVGPGKNVWTHIHVRDLSEVFVLLAESAANGGKGATWGKEGYYFTEAGEHIWGETAQSLAKKAKDLGYLKSDELDQVSGEEADKMYGAGQYMWGMNSRCVASRARNVLGWSPKEPSLQTMFEDAVKHEQELIESGEEVKWHV